MPVEWRNRQGHRSEIAATAASNAAWRRRNLRSPCMDPTIWSISILVTPTFGVGNTVECLLLYVSVYPVDWHLSSHSCGLSNDQPWCDGLCGGTNFKPVSFMVDRQQVVYSICGCKYTENPPWCDARHSALPFQPTFPPCKHAMTTTMQHADEGGPHSDNNQACLHDEQNPLDW